MGKGKIYLEGLARSEEEVQRLEDELLGVTRQRDDLKKQLNTALEELYQSNKVIKEKEQYAKELWAKFFQGGA